MKISAKLSLFFLFILTLFLSAALTFFYIQTRGHLLDIIFSNLNGLASLKAQRLNVLLQQYQQESSALARSPWIVQPLKNMQGAAAGDEVLNALNASLSQIQRLDNAAYEIFILDPRGKVIASSDLTRLGADKSDDAYFLGAQNGPYVKDVYLSPTTRKFGFAVSSPIHDPQTGSWLGVVVTRYTLEDINMILTEHSGLGSTGETYLVNKYGRMITASRFLDNASLELKVDTDNLKKAFREHRDQRLAPGQEKTPLIYDDYRGQRVIGTHYYIPSMDWVVVAEMDTAEAFLPLKKIQMEFWFFLGLVPIISLLVAMYLARHISRPLNRLREGIVVIAAGGSNRKVAVTSHDELGEVAVAFNRMADDLQTSTTSIERLNQEIAERQKIEAGLKDSDEKIRVLASAAQDAMIMMDNRGTVIFWNPAAEKIFGYSAAEIIGQALHSILAPPRFQPASQAAMPDWQNTGKGNAVGKTLELAAIRKDGVEIPVELSLSSALLNGEWQAVGVMRDITKRKKIEAQIKAQGEFLNMAINSLTHPFYIIDANNYHIVLANDAAARGQPLGNMTCHKLTHHSDQPCGDAHRCPLREVKEKKRYVICEHQHFDPDGNKKFYEVHGYPIFDQDGNVAQMIEYSLNIDDRKQAEEKIRAANEELQAALKTSESLREDLEQARNKAEAASKAKSEFLANMSHEIRTPMNAILGFGQLLQRTPLDEQQKKYMSSVQSSGELLLRVIDDILNFSKYESGTVTLENIDFDIRYLINDVFKMILPKLSGKNIDTYIDIPKDFPQYLKGDPTRIRQIFVNLLNNAVKFTATGSIGIIAQVEQPADLSGKVTLRFRVKDTGIGIPEDKMGNIFNAFEQADTSTTRKYGGTGLGLAICASLVKLMGGKVWVESQQGQGSDFIIVAPFALADPAFQADIVPIATEKLRGKKTMIVDDNDLARQITERYCLDAGIEVLAIANGSSTALDQVRSLMVAGNKPDLILMDIMMPQMDGYHLAREIKALEGGGDIKLIALTSDVMSGTAEKSQEYGFDGYLPKPILEPELLQVIAAVLGDKRAAGPIVTRHTAAELTFLRKKILAAEDNPANQFLLENYFEILQCDCDFASTGRAAIEKLKHNRYDLCLMDVHMPDIDGLEAARIIRQELKNKIPIIAVTADVFKNSIDQCLEAGMDDFVGKPIILDQLREKILKYA
ncbi:MAG: response regulator [Candidatus Omnitrophica bacterium]|nr:response regulator [Candidatus Omnitrophota bacterium]